MNGWINAVLLVRRVLDGVNGKKQFAELIDGGEEGECISDADANRVITRPPLILSHQILG